MDTSSGAALAHLALAWATGLLVVGAEAARRASRGAQARRASRGAEDRRGPSWPGSPRSARAAELPAPRHRDDPDRLAETGVPSSLLLVRPCAGLDAQLERALLSSRVSAAVVPGARIVFAVGTPGDAARPIAERVAGTLRGEGLEVEVAITRPRAVNAKSAQLAAVADRAGVDVVVSADSDVDLEEAPLRALLAALDRGAAAAWAPPIEIAPRTTADRASRSILGASMHAFTLLGPLDGGGLVGKLFAVRGADLARAGGFEAASHVLGEDVELGRRLRAAGGSVVSTPVPVKSLAQGRTVAAVVERYARWIQVVRDHRTPLLASYPALFVATPLVCALALGGAAASPYVALAAILLALAVRLGVAAAARRHATQRVGLSLRGVAELAVDAVLADLLLAAAFVRALTRSHVRWRGRTMARDEHGWREAEAPLSARAARPQPR